MPTDMKRYPAAWRQISLAVRERAGWKCERCGAPNGRTVVRAVGTGYWLGPDLAWRDESGRPVTAARYGDLVAFFDERGEPGPLHRLKSVKIVLTVAHVGENRHDKMDCSNLLALCQRCHLAEDLDDHVAHARATRQRKKRESQPALEGTG